MRFNSWQISCLLQTKSPFIVLNKIGLISGKICDERNYLTIVVEISLLTLNFKHF